MDEVRRTQAERAAESREALIAAARPLFAEHGFANVALETIVRAAGLTRGAVASRWSMRQRSWLDGVDGDRPQHRVGARAAHRGDRDRAHPPQPVEATALTMPGVKPVRS